MDSKVPVPEILDLSGYRGTGLQDGEILMPESNGKNRRYCKKISKQLCVKEKMVQFKK